MLVKITDDHVITFLGLMNARDSIAGQPMLHETLMPAGIAEDIGTALHGLDIDWQSVYVGKTKSFTIHCSAIALLYLLLADSPYSLEYVIRSSDVEPWRRRAKELDFDEDIN